MPRYQIYYSTGEWGKAWFTADDLEQAEDYLSQVKEGSILPIDLPDYDYSVKGGVGWDYEVLEEIED